MTDQPKRRRVIRLGSGRRLTLRDYVCLWRRVKAAADTGVREVRCDLEHPFDHRSVLASAVVLEQFRHGLHDRINRRVVACHGGENAILTGSTPPFR